MGMIKHYILIDTILTKNKCFNFEIGKDTDWDMYDLFHIEFQWTYKADHAGPRFSISIGKYYLSTSIYDYRHWNYEKNDYEDI